MLVVTVNRTSMNTEEKADKRLAARVTATLKSKFNEKAKELGLNESDALLALAEKFINGQIAVDGKENGDRFQKFQTELEGLKQEIAILKESRQGEFTVSGSR
jgi:antitoxin component of RelBE/YafQ-DinJ toxin-antitoxin module